MNVTIEKTILIDGKAPTAADMDQAIDRLIKARSEMTPAFPFRPDPDAQIYYEVNPPYVTEPASDQFPDHTFIAFRQNGLGWRGFVIPAHEMASIINTWTAQLSFFEKARTIIGDAGKK